jgi:hypothetical protein
MGWVDKLEAEGAKKTRKQVPKTEVRLPTKAVVVSVRNSDPRSGDPGECCISHYSVADGFVVMCDENGKPTGKKERLIGEDADRVAARLTKEAWLKRVTDSDFNRPIPRPTYRGWR